MGSSVDHPQDDDEEGTISSLRLGEIGDGSVSDRNTKRCFRNRSHTSMNRGHHMKMASTKKLEALECR